MKISPAAEHRDIFLNCNTLHEFDAPQRFRRGESRFLGNGAFRYAYLAELRDAGETVVFKSYNHEYDYQLEDFEYMRMDALVAEIFTSSPRTVSILGFCAMAMINEAVLGGRVEEAVLSPLEHESDDDYRELSDTVAELEQKDELVVLNELTGSEKLQYALDMAEAILLLHSYPGGVIVHDGKFLRSKLSHKVKLPT